MLGVPRRRGLTLFSFRGSVGTLPLLILMTFPVYIPIGSLKLHPHLIFEPRPTRLLFAFTLSCENAQATRWTMETAGGSSQPRQWARRSAVSCSIGVKILP